MVDSMLDVILQLVDSQTAEEILKVNGFTEAELRQLGFDGDWVEIKAGMLLVQLSHKYNTEQGKCLHEAINEQKRYRKP